MYEIARCDQGLYVRGYTDIACMDTQFELGLFNSEKQAFACIREITSPCSCGGNVYPKHASQHCEDCEGFGW